MSCRLAYLVNRSPDLLWAVDINPWNIHGAIAWGRNCGHWGNFGWWYFSIFFYPVAVLKFIQMIPPRLKSISGINIMHGHDEMVANVSSVASVPFSTVMTFGLDIHTSTEGIVMMLTQLRRRQHGRHFPDDVFKGIFVNENILIPTEISHKFVPNGPINNVPILVQIMAWHRPGDKPYLNQLCLDYRRIYASFGPNELTLSALVALVPPVATKLASWQFHHTHTINVSCLTFT